MFLKTQPPPKSLINKMIGLQGEHSICIIKPAEVESILFILQNHKPGKYQRRRKKYYTSRKPEHVNHPVIGSIRSPPNMSTF